jgi:hypothetical protein
VHYIDFGRQEEKAKSGAAGWSPRRRSLMSSRAYRRKKFIAATFQKGETVGGLYRHRRRLDFDQGRAARRKGRHPVQGLSALERQSDPGHDRDVREPARTGGSAGRKLEVLGVATTGYAKDILKDVLKADVALVETVAHTESALKFYEDPHVIVDVGGQDIKLIILQNGRVKDFKLNTQCSAGNGYFLQSTAEGFG